MTSNSGGAEGVRGAEAPLGGTAVRVIEKIQAHGQGR